MLSVAGADSGGWRPVRASSVWAPVWRRDPATPSPVTDPGPAGRPGPAVRPGEEEEGRGPGAGPAPVRQESQGPSVLEAPLTRSCPAPLVRRGGRGRREPHLSRPGPASTS